MSINRRQLFLNHVAQTTELALGLEVSHAKGMYIYDTNGKAYLDLNSGISVSSLGHLHPKVVAAVNDQLQKYMHTMVYGEHIQSPQVEYAQYLSTLLNNGLDNVYFVMTGSEAVEGAVKLAKKHTSRYEVISCANAYHGSTATPESLRSDYTFSRAFCPSIPGVRHIRFNQEEDLAKITTKTAAVILEPVQAEAGVLVPEESYLKKVRKKCDETGALMILDEIQTGFGRTGFLFAHKKYDVVPDILLISKSMGGGMPIGAFVGSKQIMKSLIKDPALGHITTFGGHPVCVKAAFAMLKHINESELIESVNEKEELIKSLLQHEIISEIRSSGLMMAVELTRKKYLKHVVQNAFDQGALIDFFLFNRNSFRLAPPLIISKEEIKKACKILLQACDYALKQYQ